MKWTNRGVRRLQISGRKRSVRPCLEVFEERQLLSAFTVTTTDDNGNNTTPTTGSLRAAIVNANASAATPDSIDFAIPTSDSGYNAVTGVWTLSLAAALPALTDQVYLDATSQSGYSGAPVVAMDGGSTINNALTLGAGSGGSTIKGFDITSFTGSAIFINQSNNNSIQNNYLGTDPTGSQTGLGNANGVLIVNSTGNLIGGLTSVGNLISGNTTGVAIQGSTSTDNLIQGNRIGTNELGTAAIPNSVGVSITQGSNNTIGGAAANRGNVIAFNTGSAISVSNNGTGNTIRLNSIFRNTSGISLTTGGNAGQAAPVISNVNLIGSSTSLQVATAGLLAGTILDFYYSGSGDTPGGVGQAGRVFLGSYTLTAGDVASPSKALTFPTAVPVGQYVTGIATSSTSNSSPFAANQAVVNPFIVTTLTDNGDNVSPTPGSLRAAILSANQDSTLDTITFNLGSGTFVFTPTAALPNIVNPLIIDGTSQSGYSGTPIIQLDGGGNSFAGLTLAAGSAGSTIKGLNIVNFAGAGISVASNNNTIVSNYLGLVAFGAAKTGNTQGIVVTGTGNTIGGTAAGLGNTISANTGSGVVIDTGTGNAIRGNSIFAQASPISLTNSGNANQAAPTLTAATSSAGQTTVQGTLTAAANTIYTIDLYASSPGDGAGVQAHVYLGSFNVTTNGAGTVNFTQSVGTAVAVGQTVTATATSPTSNTSALTTPPVGVLNPFLVTTTTDNGNNANPTPGSLRAAIINANATSSLDTITFALGSGTFVFSLTAALPNIVNPLIIDGTSQSGYSGTPVIQLDGGGNSFAGLTLAAGSAGSTIKGLNIVNFAGAGISVASNTNTIVSNYLGLVAFGAAKTGNTQGIVVTGSSNTIGGTGAGLGNVVSANTAAGVVIDTGTGNAIRGNSIFAQASPISLTNSGNANQVAPTLTAATSSAGQTTVQGTLTAAANTTYTIDLYASAPGDAAGVQAHVYLGSFNVTTNGAGTVNFTQSVGTAVAVGQTVTATATSPTSNTSILTTPPVNVLNPFLVTTTNDNGNNANPTPGSLRAAIINANVTSSLDTITFALGSGTFVFSITTALPNIVNPLIIDGTSQSGYSGTPIIQLDGGGNSFAGLTLAAGSTGSTIKGLNIVNFAGAGISVASNNNTIISNYLGLVAFGAAKTGNTQGIAVTGSNNTIGSTASGAGNTISANTAAGVVIDTGTGNAIRGNSIFAQASPISLTNNGNSNLSAPIILGASSTAGQTTVQGTLSGLPGNTTYTIDVYASAPGDPAGVQARIYLGSFSVLTDSLGNASFTNSVTGSVTPSQSVMITRTSPGNSTSTFSNVSPVLNSLVVTTTADNGDNVSPIPGSLRAAINAANATLGLDTITFQLDPSSGPFIINLSSALPTIIDAIVLDGTSQQNYAGVPLIRLDGGGNSFNGFTLGAGSAGSTIKGFNIVNFAGAGISVGSNNNAIQSNYIGTTTNGAAPEPGITQQGIVISGSNNTIGGDAGDVGNVIGYNAGAVGITVSGGTGNQIRRNLIFGSASGTGIQLTGGGNANQVAPSVQAVTSITGNPKSQTTIQFTLTGAVNDQITVDFYDYDTSGSGIPQRYLGSDTYTLQATTQTFFKVFSATGATAPVAVGGVVTAIATNASTLNSSPISTQNLTVNTSYVVNSNASDTAPFLLVPGTLRSAISGANAGGIASGITFAFTTDQTITLTQNLPTIAVPVTMSGKTTNGSQVTLSGGGSPNSLTGLTLGGVGGSTITGLVFTGFGANGILVDSSNNTIGGTGANQPNTFSTGSTPSPGTSRNILVQSGINNVIHGNSYQGSVLSTPEIPNNTDVVLLNGSNGGIPTPTIQGAALSPSTITFQINAAPSSVIDVYEVVGGNRVYRDQQTLSASGQITIPGTSADLNQQFFVTATSSSGTSMFSSFVTVVSSTIVTNTFDNGDNTNPIPGSLRYAIQQANAAGFGTITFDIQSESTAPYTIFLATPLNPLAPGVNIDGLTQRDSNGNTGTVQVSIAASSGITNSLSVKPDFGLILTTNNTVQGLAIYGFSVAGIVMVGANNTAIGNYLGFDAGKTITGLGNTYGIQVGGYTLPNAQFPATFTPPLAAPTGNYISENQITANLTAGIYVASGSSQNQISDNLIGTSALLGSSSGSSGIQAGNKGDGILLDGSTSNIITTNTIDGNLGYGIQIKGGANNNTVADNTIGMTQKSDGTIDGLSFGNVSGGIFVLNSTGNKIGAQTSFAQTDGVPYYVQNAPNTYAVATITIPSGVTYYHQTSPGIFTALTGPTVALDGNLIYQLIGNNYIPVALVDAGVPLYVLNTDTGVYSAMLSNLILGNGNDGVRVSFSSNTTIANNLISYNGGHGVNLIGNGQTVTVVGNRIGTNEAGDATVANVDSGNGSILVPIGNSKDGILVAGVRATIKNNVISGNQISGIEVLVGSDNTSIQGNLLGTNLAGTSTYDASGENRMGNVLDGILLNGVKNVTIGGSNLGDGNVISGNLGRGIEIRGGGANTIRGNYIGTALGGQSVADPNTLSTQAQTLGNLGDGIFLLLSQSPVDTSAPNNGGNLIADNVISGNRGYGIHTKQSSNLLVQNNKIGTSLDGKLAKDSFNISFGNNADGIFLDNSDIPISSPLTGPSPTPLAAITIPNSSGALIQNNVISNNSANGINILNSTNVVVQGNKIGTDVDGWRLGFGNASNGIFLNESDDNLIGGFTKAPALVTGSGSTQTLDLDLGNIISGNLASGILISGSYNGHGNDIQGNLIGLGQKPRANNGGLADVVIGNNVAGIIISNSPNNTIGGITATVADQSGFVTRTERNVISGNRLYGIQIASDPSDNPSEPDATSNVISGNYIGTDSTGNRASVEVLDNQGVAVTLGGRIVLVPTGNTADGIFLINSSNNTIGVSGLNPGNVISGNSSNGVRIFGDASTANVIAGNLIGLGRDGSTPLPNQANGVLLDSAGAGNKVGNGINPNIISGNLQSGVMIVDSDGSGGSLVQGNYIGTDITGTQARGNGANGVFIYGSSNNTIGGFTTQAGTGLGNVISGNIQAGVLLYTPASSAQANSNLIQGNLIGTNYIGQSALPNNADGVQIINGNSNTIRNNVISGNLASGVNIAFISDPDAGLLSASNNQVRDNIIGPRLDGLGALANGNQLNGVVIQDASSNTIGSFGGAVLPGTNVPNTGYRSNVIAGNKGSGILLNGRSVGNTVQGNYVGVGADGAAHYNGGVNTMANGTGVYINNTANVSGYNTIGGTLGGAGNLISGNVNDGVSIFGPTTGLPAYNSVLGNVIGLQLVNSGASYAAASNYNGVDILNSSLNFIGGTDPNAKNIISGNNYTGVSINGTSSQNYVWGNYIGVDPSGRASLVQDGVPIQDTGVWISGAGGNLVGSGGAYTDPGANVLSGNGTGVRVTNVAAGSIVTANRIQGNIAGLAPGGYSVAPNSEYGIFVEEAPFTLIQYNLASANQIAGIGVFGSSASRVLVLNNIAGANIAGQPFFATSRLPDELSALGWRVDARSGLIPGSQLYGVVIIGSSNNVVGAQGGENLISGNRSVGVYVSRQDFFGNTYAIPSNNVIQNNTISSNAQYGILLYNAPSNFAPPFTNNVRGRAARRVQQSGNSNIVFNNGVSFLNFLNSINSNNSLRRNRRAQPAVNVNTQAQPKATPNAQAKPLRVIMPKQH